jgi:transcriptional regulator with XRE-family HTH domain
MESGYTFEYVFQDIPSLVEAYNGLLNQSSLARISGINSSQMRQYASGIKRPKKSTLQRIESGLKKYAVELQSVTFE